MSANSFKFRPFKNQAILFQNKATNSNENSPRTCPFRDPTKFEASEINWHACQLTRSLNIHNKYIRQCHLERSHFGGPNSWPLYLRPNSQPILFRTKFTAHFVTQKMALNFVPRKCAEFCPKKMGNEFYPNDVVRQVSCSSPDRPHYVNLNFIGFVPFPKRPNFGEPYLIDIIQYPKAAKTELPVTLL